jgi:iron complex outermembrane receptor protein
VDITPGVAISAATLTTKFKGVSCLPFLVTTGEFAGAFQRCLDDHSDAVTGTAGAEWTPNSDTLAYLRYNRGYKAFGFNAGSVTANPEAAPETVDDVEVGLKQSVGSALQYNVDAFYYNYMRSGSDRRLYRRHHRHGVPQRSEVGL